MKHFFSISILFIIFIASASIAQSHWTKDPNNPVIMGGASGSWNTLVMMPSVLYNSDSSRYEMWYAATSGLRPFRIGFATSPDGITWTKLDSAVLTPTLGTWDESTVEWPKVIKENGLYKMWYTGWCPDTVGIGYATSPDGIIWTKDTQNNPVLRAGTAAWDVGGRGYGVILPVPGGYKMWYTGLNADYSETNVGFATSPDGINWTTLSNPVLTTGISGQWDNPKIWSASVVFIDSVYHMFYSGQQSSSNVSRRIGWAISVDGILWIKYNDTNTISTLYAASDPVLTPTLGQWDGSKIEAGTVLHEGDSVRMWYSGWVSPAPPNRLSIGHASAPINTIFVPGNFATIQAAINSAGNGDVVLVAEGTYQENINFKGKAITVASHYYFDGDTSHISNTIIDGSQPSHPDSGSVVYFISGEDTNSVLCGFTITGGTGTIYSPNNWRNGGGIYATDSSPHLKNNIIESNIITYNNDSYGGGIFVYYLNNNDFKIENNVIRYNELISSSVTDYSLGAGIYVAAEGTETVRICGNKIINNTISAPVGYGCGITPANVGNANYLILNNIISGNIINAPSGASGGIDIFEHFPTLHNNLFSNNAAPIGAGIGIEFTSAKTNKSGARGLKPKSSEQKFGFKTTNIEIVNLSNNTVIQNSATVSGGGIGVIGGTVPQLMNFIIWGNNAPNDPQVSGTANVQYSDVEGGHSGSGNIDLDPLFEDTINCYLMANSPCIDAGNPNSSYNDPEDPNNPGFALWPAMGALRSDMGAYGSDPVITGIELIEDIYNVPTKYVLKQNYPNPFNPSTTFEFSIPKSELVTLKIYNLLGQEVTTLFSDKLTPGEYKYTWDASHLASGVYFYKLESGDFIKTNKLVLLK